VPTHAKAVSLDGYGNTSAVNIPLALGLARGIALLR
jgi:3-oxoacyl-[acyl-carrier-protein] synthase III